MSRAGPCLLDGFAQVTLFFLNLSAHEARDKGKYHGDEDCLLKRNIDVIWYNYN